MKLYHITLWDKEKQDVIIPRIPILSTSNEDISTSRISMAPSIKGCLLGIGNKQILEDNTKIRVYSFDIDSSDEYLTDWTTLYVKDLVPDSPITHEYWYLRAIVPNSYCEYFITNLVFRNYYVLGNKYKEKLIKSLALLGIFDNCFQNKTATEIMNSLTDSPKLEKIKSIMTHQELNPDYSDLYFEIFGENQQQYNSVNDYYEYEYLDDFSMIRI